VEGLVENLAQELKKLCGWGADPKRLPVLPNLASMANLPDGMGFVPAGFFIRRFLVERINTIEGPVEFGGRTLATDQLRRAVRLLLMLEGTGLSAVNRRYRALQVLGLPVSIDQFRRPGGPEYSLMLLVAEQLAPNLQTA
jgi:hypothetical protein